MRSARRLTKSASRQLFGVAGGIAAYLNVDPVIIRVAFVIAVFTPLPSITAYIILALVMPEPAPADVIDVSPEPEGPRGPSGEDSSTSTSGRSGRTKPFVRSSTDKWLAGVCGGIGAYFNVDAVLVRALFLVALFAYGASAVIYIALAMIMPRDAESAHV